MEPVLSNRKKATAPQRRPNAAKKKGLILLKILPRQRKFTYFILSSDSFGFHGELCLRVLSRSPGDAKSRTPFKQSQHFLLAEGLLR